MATKRVDPLQWQTPITEPVSGRPTPFFIRLWQDMFINKGVSITADRQIIKYDSAGLPDPTTQTTTFTAVKTNTDSPVVWTMTDSLGNALDASLYLSSTTADVVTLTEPNFATALTVYGSQGITVIVTLIDRGSSYTDSANLTKVADGAAGPPGSGSGPPGLNNAALLVYQRSASTPALLPGASTTYDFTTGILTGLNNGWSQAIPAVNGDPLWASAATASNTATTDTIANTEWAAAVKILEDGVDGNPGSDGLNNAAVLIYKRDPGPTPTLPSVSTTYDFTTGQLVGLNNGWSQAFPAVNGDPCWVSAASASSSGVTDTIIAAEWAAAVQLVVDGVDGSNGLNSAALLIYQRAATTPTLPSASTTYTFATGVLTGLDNGWTQAIPASTGDPLWVSAASAANSGPTDTLANTEWATAVILLEDGVDGAPGDDGLHGNDGLNSATVFLYQVTGSATPPAVPASTLTYTFATGVLSGTLGSWTQTLPPSGGVYRWMTTATALSTTATDSIATGEWATVALMAQDGDDGLAGNDGINSATVYLFQRTSSSSPPATPAGSLTYDFSTGLLSGTLGSWAQSLPTTGGEYRWVTTATALSTTGTDTIPNTEWASSSLLAQDGIAGLNNATVYLFQRTATDTAPAVPSASTTYTFATGVLSGALAGWAQTLPSTGGEYRWVTTATALSSSTTDTIANTEWATPNILAQDGTAGSNAKSLIVISDRQTIAYNTAGSPNPSTQTTTFTAQKQNTTVVPVWNIKTIAGTLLDSTALTGGTTYTNYIPYSETPSSWAFTNCTFTSAVTAPDGATTCIGAIDNSNSATQTCYGGFSGISATVGSHNGVTFYVSFYLLKTTSATHCPRIYISADGGVGAMDVYVNTNTGATAGTSVNVDDAGAFWFVSGTFTGGNVGGPGKAVQFFPAGGDIATFGTGSITSQGTTYAWGFQVTEVGQASYIPTGGTSRTGVRAESVSMTVGDFGTAKGATSGVIVSATISDGSLLGDKISVASVQDGAQGSTGAAGQNTATVLLYQRSATTPTAPSGTFTYTFATAALSGSSISPWTTTIPTVNGNPCWVIQHTFTSTSATDSTTSWSSVSKLVEDGAAGATGSQATNTVIGNSATLTVAVPNGASVAVDARLNGTIVSGIVTLKVATDYDAGGGWLNLESGVAGQDSDNGAGTGLAATSYATYTNSTGNDLVVKFRAFGSATGAGVTVTNGTSKLEIS